MDLVADPVRVRVAIRRRSGVSHVRGQTSGISDAACRRPRHRRLVRRLGRPLAPDPAGTPAPQTRSLRRTDLGGLTRRESALAPPGRRIRFVFLRFWGWGLVNEFESTKRI